MSSHPLRMSNRLIDRYKKISKIAEGTYGEVFKCKDVDTGKVVAIKRFKETDEEKSIRKIALREIKMLKLLRHLNVVQLIEVFKKRKHLYLVFEFCDRSSYNDLEKHTKGLPVQYVLSLTYQLLQGLRFCHEHNCVHRDVKPENILLTENDIVKLSDFGFMRSLELEPSEKNLTDYVATRWYRAPELLVGDVHYGPKVDVWAVGCVFYEFITGNALFPGRSDLDMLYLIRKIIGDIIPRHMDIFNSSKYFKGMTIRTPESFESFDTKINIDDDDMKREIIDFLERCLDTDPARRWSCEELLYHNIFRMVKFKKPSYIEVERRGRSGSRLFPSIEAEVKMRSSLSLRSSYSDFNMQRLPII